MRGTVVRGSSADPAAGDPARPWTLNRYAYAWNDPVNYLDPDGGEPITGPPTAVAVAADSTRMSREEPRVVRTRHPGRPGDHPVADTTGWDWGTNPRGVHERVRRGT